MGSDWLDFDLKVDSNTGEAWGREEEGSGELYEPKISVSVAGFVRYSPQATQIPKGSSGNGLGFENGRNKVGTPKKHFFLKRCPRSASWGIHLLRATHIFGDPPKLYYGVYFRKNKPHSTVWGGSPNICDTLYLGNPIIIWLRSQFFPEASHFFKIFNLHVMLTFLIFNIF